MSYANQLPNNGHKISGVHGFLNNQYKDYWMDKNGEGWSIFFSENHVDERLSIRPITEDNLLKNIKVMLDTLDNSGCFRTFKDHNGRSVLYDYENQNEIVLRVFADFKEIHIITVFCTERPTICMGGATWYFENEYIRTLFANAAGKITGKKQAKISAPIQKI